MYERVVAGTDLSQTSLVAVERASWLAQKLGAELILVHAGSDPGAPLEELAAKHGATPLVKSGNPTDVLIAEARRDSDLLVVGSVGMSGARRFLLGNVPNKVSHHAPTDLLIVKTDGKGVAGGEYRSVLVGTDGSETATLAVQVTARLAAKLGITPVIVCSYEPIPDEELDRVRQRDDVLTQWGSSREIRQVPDEFAWQIASANQATDVLDRASEVAAREGVQAETRAVEGAPAEALLSVAESSGVDLIAVGSVGMSGARRFMLGNVPNRISHHSPTDLLIVRTR